ncbi:MAG: transposase [Deltaproteobacteria bacterium]|nr:transposase [Deltaproteobacteria bacterium]
MSLSTTVAPAAGQSLLPPIAFERNPGAAMSPLRGSYKRHEPEKTALYGVVAGHLETFLDTARQQSSTGTGCPPFIERELRKYLGCGILANGFARLRCPSCGFERLVAFSCKGRICPSCWARRMGDTAAHLVDRVLPVAQYRQWVLTFPWELRLTLAMNRGLLSEMLRVYLNTLFKWQRKRGRALAIRGETGAVTFIQRFGGALNTNPHFHTIVPDGLFVRSTAAPVGPGADGPLSFVQLPAPTDDDVAALAGTLASRLGAIAARYCLDREGIRPDNDDAISMIRAAAYEAQKVPLTGEHAAGSATQGKKPLCVKHEGFTLHAARTVAAHDREGLEKLCRYGLRAPFALDRFSVDPDGMIRYRLTRPWPTPAGKSELLFEPQALLRRLAALLPGPYLNLTRYHGAFANRSRFRPMLPTPPKHGEPSAQCHPREGGGPSEPAAVDPRLRGNDGLRPRRLGWAQLLRRVLNIDVLTCARCAVPMTVIAFLSDPTVLTRILDHLALPSTQPLPAESALTSIEDVFIDAPAYDGIDVEWEPSPEPLETGPPDARDPP